MTEKDVSIGIPTYFASGVQVASNGNEVMLVFTQLAPSEVEAGSTRPAVAVSMPRGTAADLEVVLSKLVASLTKELGPIDTPFLKEQRGQAV